MNSNPPYKAGDNCYFLNHLNKIIIGEIKDVYCNDDVPYAYCIVDSLNYRFNVVKHENCADDEKSLSLILKKRKEKKK